MLALLVLASLTLTPARTEQELPPGLRAAVEARLGLESYAFFAGDGADSWEARNVGQGLAAHLSSAGMAFSGETGGRRWRLGLRLAAEDGDVRPRRAPGTRASGPHASIERGDVSEWYVNDERGFEQGFTLHRRPAGEGDSRRLVLELDARFEAGPATLAIRVFDDGATYPVTIDPWVWLQEQKLLGSDTSNGNRLGISVALLGERALIGADRATGAAISSGAAYVFLRTGTTWVEEDKLFASDGEQGDMFGARVALSGDRALITATRDDDVATDAGAAMSSCAPERRGPRKRSSWRAMERTATKRPTWTRLFELAAHDDTVHVAWADNRFAVSGGDVFYQRSTDAGVTFLSQDTQLDSSGPGVGEVTGIGFDLEVAPPIVALAWNEEVTSIFDREMRAIVSLDGGNSFGADVRVDQAPAGGVDVFSACNVAVDPDSGNVVVAWRDVRFGPFEQARIFAATSIDSGASWSEAQLSVGGAIGLRSVTAPAHQPDGRTLIAFDYAGYSTGEHFSVHSLDGGATWEPPLLISDQPQAGALAVGPLAYNARYANWIHAWLDGPTAARALRAGGFRPATLDARITGAPSFQFQLSGFSGTASLGAVLVSASPGTLPLGFGDGRDLGLTFDPLLIYSLQQALGLFGADVSTGQGTTPLLPIALPPGLTLQAAAVSFNFSGGVAIDQITDVLAFGG